MTILKSECRCCNAENRKEGGFNELWFGRHIYHNAKGIRVTYWFLKGQKIKNLYSLSRAKVFYF